MKLFAALLLFSLTASAQNVNPQQSYEQTIESQTPNVWVNFNGSSATSFPDSVSGLDFSTTGTFGVIPATPSSTTNQIHIVDVALPPGALNTVKVCYPLAPGSGTQTLITLGTYNTAVNQYNITDSFLVSPALTAGCQTFAAGTGFSARNVPANSYGGFWQSASFANGPGQQMNNLVNSHYANATSTPSGTISVSASAGWDPAIQFTVTSAAVTPQQPGFDPTLPNNYSVAIPYNGWVAAPNNTLGDVDWSTPFTLQVAVDALTFNQMAGSGSPVILASKGNIGLAGANWWELYLNPNGLKTQICWADNLIIAVGGLTATQQSVCTSPSVNAVLPGSYIVHFVHKGTGWANDDQIYVQGLAGGGNISGTAFFNENGVGAGNANISITSGTGSGYTDPTTNFSCTGGGGTVIGTIDTSSGIPNGGINFTQNSGNTIAPTSCATVGGTGTGASFHIAYTATTFSTALTNPLMVGSPSGMSTNSAQTAINVDEFNEFPTALTQIQITNAAYWTKFYQQILGTPPTTPKVVVCGDDQQTDIDNLAMGTVCIALAVKHYIKLAAFISEDYTGSCPSLWLQQLQQAGLGNVPVGVVQSFASGGTSCDSSGGLATYNASTPTASSAFPNATSVYRQVLATYSTQPVYLIEGGALTGLQNLMQSSADSISPLTGAQLIAQNAANGGAVFEQGVAPCTPSSPPVPTPCSGTFGPAGTPSPAYDSAASKFVYANLGTSTYGPTPLYFTVGTPQNSGGVVAYSRTAKDPFFLYSQTYGDDRPAWDTMTLATPLTGRFNSGVMISFTGGTGYATLTPITLSGGGSGCPTTTVGYMHATGGVPDDIYTLGGSSINTPSFGIYFGLGYDCTSVPTVNLVSPTGTGVILLAYLNSYCVALSDTGPVGGGGTTSVASSACTTNQYLLNLSPAAAVLNNTQILAFWATSLIAPPPVQRPRGML
jgi:hypothetical protein